jgi:hypothetical protein
MSYVCREHSRPYTAHAASNRYQQRYAYQAIDKYEFSPMKPIQKGV